MIKHIVMWRLHPEAGGRSAVESYSVFNDAEALAAYQEHPEHQALLGFVRSIASDRGVVDYEL